MQDNSLNKLIGIIQEKTNISNIISDYISLEKKGNNFTGLCPFHSDSNPSMSVNDSKGIFKCFVCGAGGDAIAFVKAYKGISFIEAVKEVSEKAGVEWKGYLNIKEKVINPVIKRGWEINEEALNFFKYNLNNSTDNNITSYVESRGLDKEIIEKFGIGYSGEMGSLSNFLLNKGFSEDEIILYGLAKRKEDTTLQDYFIERLIFSIMDEDGNVIGFSGRVIGESKYAKYLNSPETPLFIKSKILYNLSNAKVRANLSKELIVVEGFMDVIALYKAGIENSIATMGTAFTKEHNKIIKSSTNNIVLAFDSDAAGINATISTGKELVKDQFNVSVSKVPAGKDFDELLKNGEQEVRNALDNKVTFLEFYKELIYSKLEKTTGGVNFDVLRELFRLMGNYDDPLMIDFTLNEISDKFNLTKDIIVAEYQKVNQAEVKNNQEVPFVEPPFIEQPPQIDERFKKMIENVVEGTQSHKLEQRLRTNEDSLIAYAIKNDEAFEFLCSNPFETISSEAYSLWVAYRDNKLNQKSINNTNFEERINHIKQTERIKLFGDDIEVIENLQGYIEHYEAHIEHFKKFRNQLLKEEYNKETNPEEKQNLLNILLKNK